MQKTNVSPLGETLDRETIYIAPTKLRETLRSLRRHIRTSIAQDAGALLRTGRPDHAVATSKTFRSLARVCGAAPSGEGPYVRRLLPRDELSLSGKTSSPLVTFSSGYVNVHANCWLDTCTIR